MSVDITRLFPDRDTRFHSLVRQQGRLPIDAEENFASDIAEWERDDAFTETIAPSGSPDDGFRITAAAVGPPGDFAIGAGSFYLGGARIENPAALTYRNQRGRNWLGFPMDAEGSANEAIGTARRFLVWLDAWDQTVTATEDAELRDPGLGGPDGMAARRFGWRVRATPVAGPGCVAARTQWLAARGWTGLVDAGTGALRSGGRLTVGFNPADVDQDLCAPALTPGFLGQRNECYRVMTSRPGRYVWGRDDAAPVYRVRVETVGGVMRRVVFLTRPRDECLQPRQGQTVELLRWDERLPNGQKTAEPLGRFFTVATGLSDGAITLTTPVETTMTDWLAALPATALSSEDAPNEQRFFYLRLWSGGGSGGQADHPFASGDLTGTGLRLTFDPATTPGDAWVIATRPDAPTQLLPWALKTGLPPMGPRRHVVPLAFVDLDAGTVTDCRRRFRPLFRLGGCCTVTVGDNENSWGDVSTIAEAVLRLPVSGGEICIGPGTWRELVTLTGRSNITFTGCGERTRWLAGDPTQPLLVLLGGDNIRVRRLSMESAAAPCVLSPGFMYFNRGVRGLTIEECRLTTPSGGVIRADHVEKVTIDRCRIDSGPMSDPAAANAAFAAVALQGYELTIRNSVIHAVPGATAQALALGGIHIAGDSSDIVVADCTIRDGAGNGITLGSTHTIRIPAPAFTADPEAALDEAIREAGGVLGISGFTVTFDPAGCIRVETEDPDPNDPGDGTVAVPVSDGNVFNVRIVRSLITRCGASGIATFPLLAVNSRGEPAFDAVAVERVLIEDNEITDCVRREAAPLPPVQRLFAGQGGIALGFAHDLTVRQNRIEGNGSEPSRIASGIFVGYGEGLRIEHNRIERNGALAAERGGSTGGIVVRMAMGGAEPAQRYSAQDTDRPALLVQGNVVHSPAGRALKAIAQGPVVVTGNRLTGGNPSSLFANPLQSFILFLLGTQSAQDLLANPSAPEVVDLLLFDAMLDFLGGDAVSLVNLSVMDEFLLAYTVQRQPANLATGAGSLGGNAKATLGMFSAASFRGGETIVNDNQIVLRGGPAGPSGNLSSVLLVSLDDLGFADNQTEVESDVALCLIDSIVVGTTLRVTGNRFQASSICIYSAVSLGFWMNSTALNQGTSLIFATCANAAKLVDADNLSLI
jgi:hypothetical protein